MTNREQYKQAFSALQSSKQFNMEVEKMMNLQKKHKRNLAAAAIACAAVIGASGTVYAADIGGIQEKFSVWLYGTECEVVVKDNGLDGGYTLSYKNEDGEIEELRGGGGVTFNPDGTMSEISAEEFASAVSSTPEIEEDADGKIWLYYFERKIEITGYFDENGNCRIILMRDGKPAYLNITKETDGSFPCSMTDDVPEDAGEYVIIE